MLRWQRGTFDQPEIARRDGLPLSAYGLGLGLAVGPLAVQSVIAAADGAREGVDVGSHGDRGDRHPARRNRDRVGPGSPGGGAPAVTLRRQ